MDHTQYPSSASTTANTNRVWEFCNAEIVNFDICWLESIAWNSPINRYIFVELEGIVISYCVVVTEINVLTSDSDFGVVTILESIAPIKFVVPYFPFVLLKCDGVPEKMLIVGIL